MGESVKKNSYSIGQDIISLISKRYKTITKAINTNFWNNGSDSAHSLYVGSYGRGTAVNTSDLDVLVELPNDEYDHFASYNGNGPSRLLQAVKEAILDTYPRTNIKANGQVVVISFSDTMKFEILPAFKSLNCFSEWDGTYLYPDSHMGGNWMTTNPKAEQKEMSLKNSYNESNGLLFDTCKHIRYIRSKYYSSYHLSGILIDSFVYRSIGAWHWLRNNEKKADRSNVESYEQALLNSYNSYIFFPVSLCAPGSEMLVTAEQDWDVLGKVLKKMAG